MSQNVIELNGKRYDATTGALLGSSPKQAVAHLAAKHPATPAPGRVVDGFFRRPGAAKAAKSTPKPKAAANQPAVAVRASAPAKSPAHAKPAATSSAAVAKHHPAPAKHTPAVPTAVQHHAGHTHVHTPAKAVHHRQPQRSKTLMRTVVHKPEFHLKPLIKPQAPAEIAAAPASTLARKPSVAQVDPQRLERAKSTAKHARVKRFHAFSFGLSPGSSAVPAQHMSASLPVIPVQPQPATPAPLTHHAAPVQPADIFERAIHRARSHEQQPIRRPRTRRRLTGVMAAVAAFLILGGFVTYLNLPTLKLQVASVEAGFHASMPGFRPTGYALQSISHDGGTVTLRFVSGDSSYQITQQSSNWDSQSLLDNTLALSGPHETIERAGRTIYIYGDGANASWVTGNVRYDITGDASLSADELADIAASM